MDSISSIASSASSMLARQAADLNKSATAAKASFASTLSKVQTTVIGRPETGFKSGATYDAGSFAARTKAAFGSALTAVQSAVSIRPSTGIK